ncbi:pyridoxal-phosphate dependent enzyme [Dolichospermum sp. ST_con]|nr:pyridoxal-phosphate dependent enzyme [Dolichospermum sp. ST_con]
MLLSDYVTITDVEAAQKRLLGIAHQTPVITSNTFNKLTKSQVFFKCENFQRTGAFKFRGAYNALVQLSAQQKIKGVITYSSGNHGQAMSATGYANALAGQLLNIPTIVVMPDDAPIVKQTATRGYGAEVILYNRETTNREELTKNLAAERQLTLIPPYDHPHVIAGQGTTALELIQEVGSLDLLLVCCGGGGLISGCAVATKAVLPNCKIIGVEPELADEVQVKNLIQKAHAEFGRVDILVNNAGISFPGRIENADPANWRKMIDINVLALMYTTHTVLPIFKAQKSGHIVNISSVAGINSNIV